ncbi:Progesterone receptor [Varanus komodoensis]|nr:Progesterone receptor [Varanus komodoensis]
MRELFRDLSGHGPWLQKHYWCRKFKKFNKVKVLRALDVVALQQPAAPPSDSQALAQRLSFSPSQEVQFIPPLSSVLQGIEPEVVYAGYDNTQPETPSALLTSLNQLCERQLLCVVKWSKSLPGFRNLHIDDQITLIQYSWMSLMVFAMGWRSYKHVSGQMLYFAPDLILNEFGIYLTFVFHFLGVCKAEDERIVVLFTVPLHVANTARVCQAASKQRGVPLHESLAAPQYNFSCFGFSFFIQRCVELIPLEGLRSQNQFDEMRASYIRELVKAIGLRQKGMVASSQRFYQLTKLMDSMHDVSLSDWSLSYNGQDEILRHKGTLDCADSGGAPSKILEKNLMAQWWSICFDACVLYAVPNISRYGEMLLIWVVSMELNGPKLVKQLHLYCLNTFLQSRTLSVEFPEMMSEVIAAQLPKILAGMVKPLLFHKK